MRKKVMVWLLVLALTIANSNLVYAVDTAPQTNEKNSSSDEEQENESGTNEDGAEDTTSKPNEEANKSEESQDQSLDEQQTGNASTENKNVETENIEGIEEKATAPLIEATETSGKCGENAYWEYDDGTKTLTISGSGAMGNYDYSADAPWDEYRYIIKNIVMSDRITTIGDGVFADCDSLEKVVIAEGVEKIGKRAFSGCENLKKVVFGEGVKKIEYRAFYECDALENIMISDGAEEIGEEAFRECNNLKEAVLGKDLKRIDKKAFQKCDALENIIIPNGVEEVGEHAFGDCDSLKIAVLGKEMKRVEVCVFQSCDTLEKVVIPRNIEEIGACSFDGCKNLKEVIFGKGLKKIEHHAFSGCEKLESIEIPDGVEEIEAIAFNGCKSLREVVLGEGLKKIDDYVFTKCEKLESIEIPDGVEEIGEEAFADCHSLKEVIFGEGIKIIKRKAFSSCDALEKVEISDSVEEIGFCAFDSCENLKEVILGKGLKEISSRLFADTYDIEVYFKGNAPRSSSMEGAFWGTDVKAYYPQNDSTWTSYIRKSIDNYATWIPWLPDEQKTTTSIAGKEEHYLSGQTNYETVDKLEKIDNGYSVLKNSTWKVTKTVDMSGDVLYIRSGAEVKVSGTLRAKEIVVEKGGRLSVNSKGKVTADKVTAKGGWFGDDWFGGNDSSGGMVDINSGTLQADDLNFEGRSTLHVHENGKIIAKSSMKMNTGSDGSELESGKVFIGGELTVKGKNYVAQDSTFGTVFYNSGAVLKKSGKDFCLGAVYVVDDNTFLNMNLESKNFLSAMKCKVSANWSLSNLQKIAGADYSESWNTSVESALGNINSQAAFNCVHSQLSDEECRYVEDLAAVWTTVLLAPACDGLLESKSAVCEMEFKINKKTCKLKLQGMNTGGYAKLAGVYLSVNGSDFQQIGMIANANIDEFSKKAKEYLDESAKKEIIGYASGKAAGAISSRAAINKDIVKKFVEKCAKKVCLNEAIFNETENSEIKQIKKSFKVVDLLIRSTGTRTAFNVQAGNGLTMVLNSEQVQTIMTKDSLDEPIINEFSDKVTDEWLKIRLIEILGKDDSGEPDLSKASEITTLDLSKGYIRDLSGLQHFTNLKELNLADNEVQDLSPLAGLTKLETLNVSGQFISNLYPISELKNLTALDISENEITTLSSLGHLEKLKVLNATDNRLTVINSLSTLKSLEKISLSNNPLSEGTMTALACLGNVSSVEANNCGIDKLTGIPVASLKELYVSNNNLENLSGLSEAKTLEILDVSHNYLTNTEELSALTALVQLDMRGNGLTNIAGLKNLLNLKELYLGQNGIVDKDLDYLAGMSKLEKLDLSDNLIFGLDWRKDLSALKEVNVSNTALDKQDVSVLEETGLKVIDDSEIPLLKDIYFLNTKVNLNVGNCYMQEVLTYPSDAMTNEIIWSSSDEEVVAVDKDGVITALKKGTATVTARLADEEKAVSYEVTIASSDKGDINGDGLVKMNDLLLCMKHVTGEELLEDISFRAADINGDGLVKMNDLMLILQYVTGETDVL